VSKNAVFRGIEASPNKDWFGPMIGVPESNAEPPGSHTCGAIAGQLIQAVGKFVTLQQM
jgi:hypothetical protein